MSAGALCVVWPLTISQHCTIVYNPLTHPRHTSFNSRLSSFPTRQTVSPNQPSLALLPCHNPSLVSIIVIIVVVVVELMIIDITRRCRLLSLCHGRRLRHHVPPATAPRSVTALRAPPACAQYSSNFPVSSARGTSINHTYFSEVRQAVLSVVCCGRLLWEPHAGGWRSDPTTGASKALG
jgi:hypothetical protein